MGSGWWEERMFDCIHISQQIPRLVLWFQVSGLGFGNWRLRVWGLGFRMAGMRLRTWSLILLWKWRRSRASCGHEQEWQCHHFWWKSLWFQVWRTVRAIASKCARCCKHIKSSERRLEGRNRSWVRVRGASVEIKLCWFNHAAVFSESAFTNNSFTCFEKCNRQHPAPDRTASKALQPPEALFTYITRAMKSLPPAPDLYTCLRAAMTSTPAASSWYQPFFAPTSLFLFICNPNPQARPSRLPMQAARHLLLRHTWRGCRHGTVSMTMVGRVRVGPGVCGNSGVLEITQAAEATFWNSFFVHKQF